MDLATTSPVELQNQSVHGHSAVGTNLKIEKGVESITNYIIEKLVKPQSQSLRNIADGNLSSRLPTKCSL